MEAVEKVSTEIDKVITKFSAISEHSARLIKNEIASLELLRSTLLERKSNRYIKALKHRWSFQRILEPSESQLTPHHISVIKSSVSRTKEKLQRLGMDHRDLHVNINALFISRSNLYMLLL